MPDRELPVEIEGKGISFDREFNGDGVEICVEYDDHSSFRASTLERYITIARPDWERIVDALLPQPDPEVERRELIQPWAQDLANEVAAHESTKYALGDALERAMRAEERLREVTEVVERTIDDIEAAISAGQLAGVVQRLRAVLSSLPEPAAGGE